MQQQGAPAELKRQLNKHLPNFRCLLVNLHDLSYRRLRRGGQTVSLALFGMRKGKQLGIEQGIERERQDAATRMLTRGMPEEQILDVLQLTAEQLAQIERN